MADPTESPIVFTIPDVPPQVAILRSYSAHRRCNVYSVLWDGCYIGKMVLEDAVISARLPGSNVAEEFRLSVMAVVRAHIDGPNSVAAKMLPPTCF